MSILTQHLAYPVYLLLSMINGYIPQSIAFLLFAYIINNKKVESKKFLMGSIILSVATTIIREFFPVVYGANIILNIIATILISIFICNLDTIKSVISSLVVTVVLFVYELIYIGVVALIMHGEVSHMIPKKTLLDVIYPLPCTILFCLSVVALYMRNRKRIGKIEESN